MLMWLWRSKKWIANVRIQKYNGECLSCEWSNEVTVSIIKIITIMGLERVILTITQRVRVIRYNKRHDDSKYTTNEEQ